jgi:hypothetical protein
MAGDPHRQFDFWLGEWEVRDPDGRLVGRNRIDRLFGGIGLQEHWEGASGLRGVSYNVFVPELGQWHQTWVDSSGELLLLGGGFRDGSMVLEGMTASVRHRISWSVIDNDPDRVRQLWETSNDDGASWQLAFDGRYRRMDATAVASTGELDRTHSI